MSTVSSWTGWSSQGIGIVLRAEMQAALDTVLARSGAEVRARFEQLRTATVDQGDGQPPPLEPVGERGTSPVSARLR